MMNMQSREELMNAIHSLYRKEEARARGSPAPPAYMTGYAQALADICDEFGLIFESVIAGEDEE